MRSVLLKVRFGDLHVLVCSRGLDIANMYVFLGEKGDTNYEEMNGGMHKAVILRGIENMGRSPYNYDHA